MAYTNFWCAHVQCTFLLIKFNYTQGSKKQTQTQPDIIDNSATREIMCSRNKILLLTLLVFVNNSNSELFW